MSERYDIAIIGTGPAGLSAAITAKIRNKKILLIGSKNLSPKVQKAHTIKNYLGLPDVGGEELGKRFAEHLENMEIEILDEMVTAVYQMGDTYQLQIAGDFYETTSVILATGVDFGKPYPGEDEFLGRGVSYCATCDAPLYKGKTAAIVGFSPKEEAEAEFLAEVAEKVYYLPMYEGEVHFSKDIEVLKEKPLEIKGVMKAEKLVTDQRELEVDGIFLLRECVSPGKLVPGLKLDGNHVEVDRKMATNLKGCFACGDIVGAPYQYIKAAGEGNVAALSAVAYVDELKVKNQK
ncbi:MAG: NAD(P)/FAD-dependent oxidoreductase [Roseburia sp.]